MNRKSRFGTVLQLLLLVSVIFFGISITNALDRNRREIAELKKLIESKTSSSMAFQTLQPSATDRSPAENTLSPLAEYFAGNYPDNGVLHSAVSADAGSLNPVLGNEATASSILALCTSVLGTRDLAEPEKFVPLLAESWSVSKDGRHINIKLRKNVLWQSFTDPETNKFVPEKEVTAHDVVFYLDVIRNPEVNAGMLRGYFQDLESIRALNDHELELVWKNEYFRSLEMSLGLIPLPRHFYCPENKPFDPAKFNDDYKRNSMIVGCGPYKLVRHIKDRRFELERFENYFGNRLGIAPGIKKRILEIVKADNTRFQMLQSGKLDMLGISAEQWVKRAQGREFSKHVLTVNEDARDFPLQPGEKFLRVKHLANAYFYIGYNQKNELFADRQVRRAMTMLCNRERILNEIYHGQGKIISGPFFYNSPYYDHSIKPFPFAPEKAAGLLAAAGWRDSDGDGILDKNGRKFVFTALQVAGNPVQEKILSIFKEDLAKAGIDMKIVALEWPVYIGKLDKRDYEVCSLGWQLPFESDPYQVWHSSQAKEVNGSNHIGFMNPEADRLIEAIRRTNNVEERIKLCHEFHKVIHEEQPYTFLLVPESLQLLSGRIKNVRCFPLGLNSECFYLTK